MTDSKNREIYELMKDLIVNQKLRPGMQLKEKELADKFGTSRTPIRQAFKGLEADGLVENIPNKGAYVVDPSIEDICYAYELRVTLEKMLSEEIIDKVSPKDIEILENYVAQEPDFYEKNEVLNYLENNKKFHLKIARISDNKYLVKAIEDILSAIDIHLIFYDNFNSKDLNNIESIKDHELIIKALKERKLPELKRIMLKHIENTCEKLKKNKEDSNQGQNSFLL